MWNQFLPLRRVPKSEAGAGEGAEVGDGAGAEDEVFTEKAGDAEKASINEDNVA